MNKETEVIISARCSAAARGGTNEDNCLVIASVGKNAPISHTGDGEFLSSVVSLKRNGAVLVVADGMGGMNAGEVASKIAVDTISSFFTTSVVDDMELTDDNIKRHIRQAILAADNAIKTEAKKDSEKDGMGTTVALLWLFQKKAFYAWCGDSRVYCYSNSDNSLYQLSSDHSYVCEILKLSEEEAFNHPNNNVITRCLGNPSEKANPDIPDPIGLTQGDLFLLCSDGFCGCIRNFEIADLLATAQKSPLKLNETNLMLWKSAEEHHWHDNVTTLMCYIKSGPEAKSQISEEQKQAVKNTFDEIKESRKRKNKRYNLIAAFVAILVTAGIFILFKCFDKPQSDNTVLPQETHKDKIDSVQAPTPKTIPQEIPTLHKSEPPKTSNISSNTSSPSPSINKQSTTELKGYVPNLNEKGKNKGDSGKTSKDLLNKAEEESSTTSK